MNILVWTDGQGFIIQDGIKAMLEEKPDVLSLDFDSLYYEPQTLNMIKVIGEDTSLLTEDEIIEVGDFTTSYVIPVYKHYVDDAGAYIGQGNYTGTIASTAPPTDGNYYWLNNGWELVFGVNDAGIFIGNSQVHDVAVVTPTPPDNKNYIWNFVSGSWDDTRSLSAYIESAKTNIDTAAGAVRAKYITSVEGQSETYREKLDDANNYAAAAHPILVDFIYVYAESVARGISGDAAASFIIETAASWRIKGAAIEVLRITGKVNQDSAVDLADAKLKYAIAIADIEAM